MQLTLKLDASARRPVVKLDWFNGCRALLDTGALFPVWTANGNSLQQLGAKLIKEKVNFGGFGGDAEGSLYRIDFQLGGLILKISVYLAGTYENVEDYEKSGDYFKI